MDAPAHLSDKARAAEEALRQAAGEYQAVIEEILRDPNGEIVERLRHAGEKVSGAALHWALANVEGGGQPD